MQAITYTLTPLSAFATPIVGDTLFGQLCWAIRNRYGEQRLEELLQGYTENQPFAIVSDAFPAGYLPKPTLPAKFLSSSKTPANERKALKKKIWMPLADTAKPLNQWQAHCKSDQDITLASKTAQQIGENSLEKKHIQPHNTINRFTGTTGEGQFAPYGRLQTWYQPNIKLQCHILIDSERFSPEECQECLQDIGNFGFGRDASIGMGKFSLEQSQSQLAQSHPQANAVMTLAPVAPQNMGYDAKHSYYLPFTRFGKHGDIAVHQKGKPFKNPVLMAKTAGIFTSNSQQNSIYIGQGLGGSNDEQKTLSKSITQTVQQGYAPVIGVYLEPQVESHT